MIDLAIFDPQELSNANNDVFPLVIGAEAADGSPIYSLAVLESRGNKQYNGRIVKRVMRDTLGRLGEIVPIYSEEGGQCVVVCMESYANESLIPCNHSVCSRCRVQLPSQKCPICRQRIQQVVLLHVPGSGGDEA